MRKHTMVYSVLGSQLISIRVHCDLDFWPLTSKINRVYPLTKVNIFAKFDEEIHNNLVFIMFTSLSPYMSIVTLTFDLWPSQSIGFILSPWLTCLPSLIKNRTRFSCYRVHKLISIYHICPLWPWPLTSKINRVHSLTMANSSAKFDQEAHNSLVAIVFTSLFPYMSIVTLTFDLWPPKSIGSILSP